MRRSSSLSRRSLSDISVCRSLLNSCSSDASLRIRSASAASMAACSSAMRAHSACSSATSCFFAAASSARRCSFRTTCWSSSLTISSFRSLMRRLSSWCRCSAFNACCSFISLNMRFSSSSRILYAMLCSIWALRSSNVLNNMRLEFVSRRTSQFSMKAWLYSLSASACRSCSLLAASSLARAASFALRCSGVSRVLINSP
mmetsp:Transcript_9890/g.26862  ORF Transcript_9890/g.26862 Transcript_9890/m.26862 type:complete len:201 (-) Transcript_9890:3108-3710(-)